MLHHHSYMVYRNDVLSCKYGLMTATFSILLRYRSSAYVWVLWRKSEITIINLFLRRCAYFSAFLLHRGKCRGVADVPYRFHLLPLRHAYHHVVECHCNQRTNWGRWYLVSIQTALRAQGWRSSLSCVHELLSLCYLKQDSKHIMIICFQRDYSFPHHNVSHLSYHGPHIEGLMTIVEFKGTGCCACSR